MDERASARAGAAVSRRFAMSDYASHGRCMCGADDCEACRPGCRRPAEDRDESPECDECGETRGRYHMPGDGVGVYRTITIEEMGGRPLCTDCRAKRALCDDCGACVLNEAYDDDGRCPACAERVALERAPKAARDALALVRLAAGFGVDLHAINMCTLAATIDAAAEYEAASTAYLRPGNPAARDGRSVEESQALARAYEDATLGVCVTAAPMARARIAKVRP